MNQFEEYLMNLPRVTGGDSFGSASFDKLKAAGEPFITGEIESTQLHDICKTECPTRIINIYVPEININIPREYAHCDAENPLEACKEAYKNTLTAQNIKKGLSPEESAKVTEAMIEIGFEGFDFFPKLEANPKAKLIAMAKLVKIGNEYEGDYKRMFEFVDPLIRKY